ncbi:MAG: crossover junction endodeoxyribonuclease RuvC [Candidatus Aminicenantia bacterium]
MKVIGIDPGTKATGFGVIESIDNHYRVLGYGVIHPAPKLSLANKLKEIKQKLEELIIEFSPDAAAVENLFYAQNVKTAIILGGVRGVVLSVLASHQCPIFEYTPLEVKKAITGYGRAEKNQVNKMIQSLVKINDPTIEKDASDALAVAICHLNSINFKQKLNHIKSSKANQK